MDNLTLMTVISFIVFMSGGITGPVNSLYVESLGASYATIGLLGTVASLTTIVSSALWGRASDLAGRRKQFLVGGLLVAGLSYGLMAFVQHYVYLFVLRILWAAASSAYATSSLALMGDLLETRVGARGRRMGVYRGLGSLGFGLMAFLSGAISDRFSIRAPFALAGLFVLAGCVVSLLVRERAPKTASTDSRVGPWQIVREAMGRFTTLLRRQRQVSESDGHDPQPSLTPLLVSSFLWALVTGAVYAVWANYMVGELGYSQTAMSRLWSLASTSELAFMIAAGWLSDRIGRVPMLSLGFVAWALVFVGYVLVPGMPWILGVQLIRGFAYSAFTATAMTYATEIRGKEHRGRVSGLYSAAGGVGAILGSALGGLQTEWMGFRPMIATNAALIFCGAIYLATVAVEQRKVRDQRRRMSREA